MPEWQIYPVAKVINKTYAWRQSTETYVEQTVQVTAGPRLDPTIADPSAPTRTYPPDALGARLYDRDLLKAVLLPGAGPGAYNKIGSTWAETHVNDQKTWLRANDTLSDTEVLGLQHTVLHAATTLSETTVGSATSITHDGSITNETTVGTQTTILTAGSTYAQSTVGEKTTLDVVGLSTALAITGIKTSVSITGVDLSLAIAGLKLALNLGPHQTWTFPKEEIFAADTSEVNAGKKTKVTAGPNSSTAAVTKIQ